MKILIVSTYDLEGGAGRAAYRLFESLQNIPNISVEMLVQSKRSDHPKVMASVSALDKTVASFRPSLDQAIVKTYKRKSVTAFSPALIPFSFLVKKIKKINPDIVHFHWVNNGMLRIEDLKKIKKPMIWSLHDMWPFTGGCHYDESCGGYIKNCGACKVLDSKKRKDLSRKVFQRKSKVLSKIENLTIIGLSRWLTTEAKKSTLFASRNVVNLPNPINCNVFSPFDKKKSRELLGLPANKKLVLFGAMNSTSDPRKGFHYLVKSIQIIDDKDIEFVVFGGERLDLGEKLNAKFHYIGSINDDVTLRLLYSSANVTAIPSIQENLSNTIMESMSCGTPVVAFSIGGNVDLIDHNINGYLANPFDSIDLANGIKVLLNENESIYFGENAREKVLRNFEDNVVSYKYVDLYRKILML